MAARAAAKLRILDDCLELRPGQPGPENLLVGGALLGGVQRGLRSPFYEGFVHVSVLAADGADVSEGLEGHDISSQSELKRLNTRVEQNKVENRYHESSALTRRKAALPLRPSPVMKLVVVKAKRVHQSDGIRAQGNQHSPPLQTEHTNAKNKCTDEVDTRQHDGLVQNPRGMPIMRASKNQSSYVNKRKMLWPSSNQLPWRCDGN